MTRTEIRVGQKVVVKGSWLAACGFNTVENTAMEVLRVLPRALPDGTRFYEVKRPDGATWLVNDWRIVR